jgi:hypothetical protein
MRRITVVSLSLFLLTLGLCSLSTPSSAQIAISVGFGPPALPVYEQPICPGDGYIWTPGYWAWDPDAEDYYWVPGTWVLAPEVGFLWTPPWWGWEGGRFFFHQGWWGPHIGFYGGVNYGFGYFGVGFVGGRWDGGHFFYNRSVTNVNVVNIHNVYNETVNVNVNRVSYNGGPGGIEARPRPEEEAAARERHLAAVPVQRQHMEQARGNRELRASFNQGKPPIAATGRPGEFSGHEVVASREAGGAYHPPANRGGGGAAPREGGGERTFTHPNDLPPIEHGSAPNTGNPKLDQKYQKQQQKLYDQQNKERQKLQQQQEKEHQQAQQQSFNEAQKQQMEQRHQQQTQQMVQKHTEQRQQMQQRQAPPPPKRR